MRNAVAKTLKAHSKNSDGSSNRPKYKRMKKNWNKLPHNKRVHVNTKDLMV